MSLLVGRSGDVLCPYGEEIDLGAVGALRIRRASRLEPDEWGRWWADLSPAGGPRLGPFGLRGQALTAENRWVDENLEGIWSHWKRTAPVNHSLGSS